jgi:hypothetical protein
MLPLPYQLLFGTPVLGEQKPRPRQGQGSRLVPGEIKRHRLIPKLPVSHTRAVFVLGK